MLQKYESHIHPIQGNYIVSTEPLSFDNKTLVLSFGEIKVGEKTTLCGWFEEPCEFMGFLKENQAAFFLGKTNGDLFSSDYYYYDITFIIAENRIGKSYKQGTFRDVFLNKDDKGNLFWK